MEPRTDASDRSLSSAALLTGAILILVGGISGSFMMGPWTMGTMMHGYAPAIDPTWTWGWMLIWSIVPGILVLLASVRVRAGVDANVWGMLAIIAGVFSLLSMGGYILGAVAAIIGGALALGPSRQGSKGPPGRGH